MDAGSLYAPSYGVSILQLITLVRICSNVNDSNLVLTTDLFFFEPGLFISQTS